ncbi:hypothetical protein J4231_01690 [Candidatus Woesearchaeota archaeon]|nr:hypothetical protein [Candidatus Woesearchaeota archaeon]
MPKSDIWDLIAIFGQIVAYILAIILIIQILRAIFGGTWEIENIILALIILNLTVTFGISGYIISLNNKISGHIGWHRGISNG